MAKRSRRIVTVVAAVVIVGAGAVFWATSASSSPGYRTAAAGPAEVTATLDTTGTIQPVTSATLSFPSSGLVSSVPVQVGQQVTAGQPLAQLDPTSLQSQVASAQSTLATAQAKLAADQTGQSAQSSQSAQGGEGTSSSSAGRATPAIFVTSSAPQAPADLKAQQDAVIAAQHQVDLDLTASSAAVSAQQKACKTIVEGSSPKDSSSQDTKPPDQDTVDACTQAIQDAQNAQRQTGADEQKLADAENALSQTLAKLAATATSPAPPAGSGNTGNQGNAGNSGGSKGSAGSDQKPQRSAGSGSGAGTGSGSGSRSSGSSGGGAKSGGGTKPSQPASAEQLAADQAAIDADNAQVAVAQQNLAAATLVSPIDGTVGSIDFKPGQAESAAQHVVVFGPGTNQVTTAVSDVQAGQIKPGQRVNVTPDGSSTALTGQVTSIGLLSTTTSGGSPSYPVTISLPAGGALHPGATASVSIVTNSVQAPVTVPTSAVHLLGGNASVTVVSAGKTQVKRVTVGVLGATVTEVRSGLNAGEQVVLADLSQPLPTSNTSNRGLVGGGGGGGPRRG